jgi:hypothetical protein
MQMGKNMRLAFFPLRKESAQHKKQSALPSVGFLKK